MNRMDEDSFVKAICSQLDASIEHLDPVLEARLDATRQAAVASCAAHTSLASEDRLLQNARTALEASPDLPPAISTRLDAARRAAMAQMAARQSNPLQVYVTRLWHFLESLLDSTRLARPAQMLATACVMITVVSLFYASSRPTGTLPLEEEMALIASAEDFELYENLDFYLWLAENGLPN